MRSTALLAHGAFAVLIGLLVTTTSGADSALELPYPTTFGAIPAVTYDPDGERVGAGRMSIAKLADGRVRLNVRSSIEGGASMEAMALLGPIEGKDALRVLAQSSESRDPSGRSLGVLRVDHVRGVASCSRDGVETERMALPADERVANVTLNLLFRPMAAAPGEAVDFQIFLCRGGPRVVDFSATRTAREGALPGDDVIEISYRPNLGRVLNWVADGMIPKLSFWLDGEGNYLAHRIPLYQQGPEVLVVRDGVSPVTLRAQQLH